MTISVEIANSVTDELETAFRKLAPQLSSSNPAPGADTLQMIVESSCTALLIARNAENRIVGTLTLVTFRIPTGFRAWIEDVVVDADARGQGVGEALCRTALELAKARGAITVDLTSRPSREAANRLYQRVGFEMRETNVYRIRLT